MHGSLQWTGGHSCEGIVPGVHLGEKRMETTDLGFSSCFGVFLILAKTGDRKYSIDRIELGIDLV